MHDATSNPSDTDKDFEFVDLYVTSNFTEVDILTDIFKDNHIAFMVRDMAVSMFPMSAGEHGQTRIAVEESKVGEATALINLAISDEAVPGDGNFIVS